VIRSLGEERCAMTRLSNDPTRVADERTAGPAKAVTR